MIEIESNKIFKKIRREIIKNAKKGNLFYYWDITGISHILVNDIVVKLENDGKQVKSKGVNFKLIMW